MDKYPPWIWPFQVMQDSIGLGFLLLEGVLFVVLLIHVDGIGQFIAIKSLDHLLPPRTALPEV